MENSTPSIPVKISILKGGVPIFIFLFFAKKSSLRNSGALNPNSLSAAATFSAFYGLSQYPAANFLAGRQS